MRSDFFINEDQKANSLEHFQKKEKIKIDFNDSEKFILLEENNKLYEGLLSFTSKLLTFSNSCNSYFYLHYFFLIFFFRMQRLFFGLN